MKDTVGTPEALLLLAGFMVAGLVLTLFIDEKRGHALPRSQCSQSRKRLSRGREVKREDAKGNRFEAHAR
jgi:hypothetical protein